MRHLADQIQTMKDFGFKVTHQRLVVLDYLQRSKEHPCVEKIYNDLKERYPTLSLATIYNTLEMLEKTGLVKDIGAPEERRRFDGIMTEHSHFFCTKCGKIEDLVIWDKGHLMEAARNNGRSVDRLRLDFFGLCKDCQVEEKTVQES